MKFDDFWLFTDAIWKLSFKSLTVFSKTRASDFKMTTSENAKKITKTVKFQMFITFFVLVQSKKRKYVSDSKFYELSENQHHLSDSLN